MARFYRGKNFNTKIAKDYSLYLKWMMDNLNDDYHILIEFTSRNAVQTDILVFHEMGIYFLEIKNFSSWTEINPNGKWKYRDEKTSSIRRYYRQNPFIQVKNASNNFLKWLLSCREYIFSESLRNRLRVFPYVLSPAQTENPEIIMDDWVVFLAGTNNFVDIFMRKWNTLRIHPEGIEYIIKQNYLDEISDDDLLELMNRRDWWMDFDIVKQFKKTWGDRFGQKFNLNTFEEIEKKFIDLNVIQIVEGEEIIKDIPLTEVTEYELPDELTTLPSFFFPSSLRRIVDDYLNKKGFDIYEKPYAEWRALWNREKRTFSKGNNQNKTSSLLNNQHVLLSTIIHELENKNSWIIGPAGSGKSFSASFIWNDMIERYIKGDLSSFPLIVDCSFVDFNIFMNELFDKIDFSYNKETELLEKFTYHYTHFKLPEAENIDVLNLILIIDSVDELQDFEGLLKLLDFARMQNFPVILLGREMFFLKNKNLFHNFDTVYFIQKPSEYFRNSILTPSANQIYSNLSLETMNNLNSPLFLSLFSVLSSKVNFEDITSESGVLFLIIQEIIKSRLRELGIILKIEEEKKVVERIINLTSEIAFNEIYSNENMDSLLEEIVTKNIKLKQILIKSDILDERFFFKHQLYSELFSSLYILHNEINNNGIKYQNIDHVCRFCAELYNEKLLKFPKKALKGIQALFSFNTDKNPFLIAELFFPSSLNSEQTQNLLQTVNSRLIQRRRLPRTEILGRSLLDILDEKELNIYPINKALSIFSNIYFQELMKKEQNWHLIFENLIYCINEIELKNIANFNLSHIKNIEFIQNLFYIEYIEKKKIIFLVGKTQNPSGIEFLLDISQNYEFFEYRNDIISALRELALISGNLLLEKLENISDINTKSIIIESLKYSKSLKNEKYLLEIMKEDKNFALKLEILDCLNQYRSSEIRKHLLRELDLSKKFEKKMILEVLSKKPFYELRRHYFDLIDNDKQYYNALLFFRIFENTLDSKLISQINKFLININSNDVVIIETLISIANCQKEFVGEIVKTIENLINEPRILIQYLLKIPSEKSACRILYLVENYNLINQREIFFKLTLFGKLSLKPILEALSLTENPEFSFELIRLLGLLGLSDTLEYFPERIKCKEKKLNEIIIWTLMRISKRNPQSLFNKLMEETTKTDLRLIHVAAFIRSPIFIKSLRIHWENIKDTPQEPSALFYLLLAGDEQIAARTINIIHDVSIIEQKISLLYLLGKINHQEIIDTFYQIFEESNHQGEKIACLTGLIKQDDEKINKNWVEFLEKTKYNAAILYLNNLYKNSKNPIFLEGFESHIQLIHDELVKNILCKIFGEEYFQKKLLNRQILNNVVNIKFKSKEFNNLKENLRKDGKLEKLVLNIRRKIAENNSFIGPYSQTIIPFQNLESLFFYICDQLSIKLTKLSLIITKLIDSTNNEIFDFIQEKKNSFFTLLTILASQKSKNLSTLEFLLKFLNSEQKSDYLRDITWSSLKTQLALFPEEFYKAIGKFEKHTVVDVIKLMEEKNQSVNKVCKSIIETEENPAIRLEASFKVNNAKLKREMILTNLEKINDESQIKRIVEEAGKMGISELIPILIDSFLKYDDHNLRNAILKSIERIGDISQINGLIKLLSNNNITRLYYSNIIKIISQNICSFILDKLLEIHQKEEIIKSKDLIDIILKSRNQKYTEYLILFAEKEGFKEKILKDSNFVFFVNPESTKYLKKTFDELENNFLKSKIEGLLLSTGRCKYLESWLNNFSDNHINDDDVYWIKIYSNYQKEYIFGLLSKTDDVKANRIIKKIQWSVDLEVFEELLSKKKKTNSKNLKSTIDEIIANLLGEIAL